MRKGLSCVRAGFSLVETAVVVAIIGVASAIAVPRYWDALDRYGVDGAARRVAADLEYARRTAMSASSTQEAVFATHNKGNQYTLSGVAHLDKPHAEYCVDFSAPDYRVQLTAADFGGDSNVTFNRFGQADSDGSLTLERGAHQVKVLLDGSTGKVTIQ